MCVCVCKITGRDKEGVSLGFCFYRDGSRKPRVLRALSLLATLKHKSGNLKCRKRKKQRVQVDSNNEKHPRSVKQRS